MMRTLGWAVMTLLATLVATYALMGLVTTDFSGSLVAELLGAKPWRAAGHFFGGGVALLVGAVQLNAGLRFRRPSVHRLLGRVYLGCVLIGGVSAALLAPSSLGGIAAHFGFGMLAVLWVGTATLAVARARAGDYVAHRAWMIRSYALCLAAVTLRLYLPLFEVMGVPFEAGYPAIAWLCWVPNLVVAEWLVIPGALAPLDPVGDAGLA